MTNFKVFSLHFFVNCAKINGILKYMDIARIRKKLKEAQKKKTEKGKKPARAPRQEEKGPDTTLKAKAEADDMALQGEAHEEAGKPARVVTPESVPEPAAADHDAPGEEAEPENAVEFLKFSLDKEDFALRVSEVEEILRPQKVTPVPRVDPFVLGITSFRGKIVPLVDIGRRLAVGNGGVGSPEKAKIVILRGPRDSIGIPVEGGMDVITLPEDEIEGPPSHLAEEGLSFVEGVAALDEGFVYIIRLEQLLDFNVTGT
jgi:purine-binding chemotaxis protein CheW